MARLSVASLALSASAMALAPQQAPKLATRRSLGGFVGAAAAAVAAPALAYEGVYSMEIVKAGDAVLDKEALNSGPVKAALGDFKGYAIGIVNLQKALAANDQADVAKTLKTDYDFVKVRATFNALTPVFDEDTQKGVDRITRGILQDLVEAEAAAKFNDKGQRTPKKLALLSEKLTKLDGSFRKLFSYLIADSK